jgi:putative hydrolase of the HAD superfamily
VVKAVLFDLDDTLLDHTGAATRAIEGLYAHHGARTGLALPAFRKRWLELTELAMDKFASGQLSPRGQRHFRVRAMFGKDTNEEDVEQVFAAYLAVYQQSLVLFDDVLPCLAQLGDVRLGIVSNGSASVQHDKLRRTGILDRFEVVATPSPGSLGKPAPDLFLEAAQALAVLPSECIMVGDHLERDARAAMSCGMQGVWLERSGERDVPDVRVIRGLLELVESRAP